MTDFKTVEASVINISELMQPSHSNFGGKIHGGYILNLMDQIAFACASKHSETYCVTASVDTVDFLNPIDIGELVTMKASINFVGHTSMVVGIRVESENIRTGKVKHCNSSYFTMVAKDDHGNSVNVPGLILNDKNEVKRFLKAIKRTQTKRMRKSEFDKASFSYENYMEELKQHNVKIELPDKY
ncbi:acyl-CoA thioesterase [Subsaximicrobium wynnwilliamsii]|uniref:Acyl-CoA thioesterase n=1 Tax=Subsaximicrobium wynnwilliamsii TaxID=291179 RepID=A0A5C6ZC62_9FLAO|nr:acyl-CoA thioesterase [Subsaximicrobium wynnwilliamsii]TXD83273.1 acyl-CoA thioesterase [Subsaximicrobium wynnwilliamsii]TXD87372.1 acyl-CoA thioesterase [Subsaximicrobium wynnwilliamsii]TXE03296.1 acyl-CoA thioesterase [Subsaximicrobium wynnwilliamsii]